MSYRFCFGASGAGKTHHLIEEVTRRANAILQAFCQRGQKAGNGITNFLYIVPEQFTMQTQKDLVLASPAGGIMNIDVLSFGRLGYRIFEEVGTDTRTALDDVGKSLILQRVASSLQGELRVIGRQMNRPGMIAQVKSMVSEFMQYDLTPADVGDLASFAAGRGQNALSQKLLDLKLLYQAFLDFEKDHFETSEEKMELLAEAIPQSALLPHSLVVFDGFTGFTPVQYKVLEALLQTAPEVIFAITMAEDGGPAPKECQILPTRENKEAGLLPVFSEEQLFYLSRKTIRSLCVHAARAGAAHGKDIYVGKTTQEMQDITPYRFRNNPQLAFLERHFFRYPSGVYHEASHLTGKEGSSGISPALKGTGDADTSINTEETGAAGTEETSPSSTGIPSSIELFAASTVHEEVRQIAIRIRELVRTQGYAFRHMAVICGDLEGYAEEIRQTFGQYEIPVYIDQTRKIIQNPLTEAIQSALEIADNDYSYVTVFRYLRSGLSHLSRKDVDLLENYCLAHGITSHRKWTKAFDEEVEASRLRFLAELAPLDAAKRGNAGERTQALRSFLDNLDAESRMQAYAEEFRKAGKLDKQQEYEQCYGLVCQLLTQIYDLLGEEKISAADYEDLVRAGFEEMRLGTLPQQVDRVLAGDMERTRLGEVQVLFLCGANDGNIPKNTSKGGLISDMDREFLLDAGKELAPTPREQMYIQRLYLYMNLTRASERLIVSFARMGAGSRSLRPSYLISTLQKMFPTLSVSIPEERPLTQQLVGPEDTRSFLAGRLRAYAAGTAKEEDRILPVFAWCIDQKRPAAYRKSILSLKEAAFLRYTPRSIRPETAARLYGKRLYGSVSRLENAVLCYLKQFLRYGLRLQQREEYNLQPADAGTILHNGIARFSGKLQKDGVSWNDVDEARIRKLVHEAIEEEAADFRNHLLLSSSRSQYGALRAERILERTVQTLQFQLQQGSFVPVAFEQPFGEEGEFRFALPDGGEMVLRGRIDRVDVAKDGAQDWIKIIDYKSGSLDLDEEQIVHGLRLQLMVYMNAFLALWKGTHPDIDASPAALLYYRFEDPMLTGDKVPEDMLALVQEEAAKAAENEQTASRLPKDTAGESQGVVDGLQNPAAASAASLAAIRRQLRPKGMVNEDEEAIDLLDHNFTTTSLCIPVTRTRRGGFTKASKTFTKEEYETLSQAVVQIIINVASHILHGDINADPALLQGGRTACTFCEFADSCGFDPRIQGCHYWKPDPLNEV